MSLNSSLDGSATMVEMDWVGVRLHSVVRDLALSNTGRTAGPQRRVCQENPDTRKAAKHSKAK